MPDESPITQQAQGSYLAQAAYGGSATVNVVLPSPAVQEQNRVRFLKRLRCRYEDQWEQSLEGAGLLIGLASKPDAVLQHTGALFPSPQEPARPLPPGTSIAQVYEQAGQELLILGEPGTGKSTLLLDLARRLVERAQHDASQPLPVIISLSSWAVKQQSLTTWLSEQVSQLYNVPRRLSYAWVQTDQLLLLLDGLDEVPQEARTACLEAITAYRKEHLVPLALCSRRLEYEEIPRQQRLLMQSAVVIQPLTQEQVKAYLLAGGEALTPVRTVLRSNPVLQDLVTTPLLVQILTLTYTGSKARDLPQGGSPEEQQRSLFASYIEGMIERKRHRLSFPRQRIIPWLSWLARQMQQQSQTVFYLEQIQPDWLPGRRWSRVYDALAVLLPGMLIGVLVSLFVYALLFSFSPPTLGDLFSYLLTGALSGGLFSGRQRERLSAEKKGTSWRSRWPHSIPVGPLCSGLLVGLGMGLSFGPLDGVSFGLSSALVCVIFEKRTSGQPQTETKSEPGSSLWRHLVKAGHLGNGLLVGGLIGLSYVLHGWLDSGWSGMLGYGVPDLLASVVIGVLLSVILVGGNRTIQPTEHIIWSWNSLWRSLINVRTLIDGLLVGAILGLGTGLSFGLQAALPSGGQWSWSAGLTTARAEILSSVLSFGLIYLLLAWFLGAVSGTTLPEQHRLVPNEGIRRSARNSILLGLLGAAMSLFIYFLSNILYITAGGSPHTDSPNWLLQVLSDVPVYRILVALSGGLLMGLLNGGLASLRHSILRFLLWRTGVMPWPYVRFLNEATACILLRRVGGGYSFVHRLILDYFASLDTPLTNPETTQPSQAVPPRVCRACGYQEERPGARFCAGCGTSLVV